MNLIINTEINVKKGEVKMVKVKKQLLQESLVFNNFIEAILKMQEIVKSRFDTKKYVKQMDYNPNFGIKLPLKQTIPFLDDIKINGFLNRGD